MFSANADYQLIYTERTLYNTNSADRGQYRQDRGRPRYEHSYRRGNFRGTLEELW